MLHIFYPHNCVFVENNSSIPVCLVGWNVQRDGHLCVLRINRIQISTGLIASIFPSRHRRWRSWNWSVSWQFLRLDENILRISHLFSRLTETGVYKTKAVNRTMVQSSTTIVDANDEERELMLNKRESSHEYDWILDILSENSTLL